MQELEDKIAVITGGASCGDGEGLANCGAGCGTGIVGIGLANGASATSAFGIAFGGG